MGLAHQLPVPVDSGVVMGGGRCSLGLRLPLFDHWLGSLGTPVASPV